MRQSLSLVIFVALFLVSASAAADTPNIDQLQKEQRAIFEAVAPSVVFITHGDSLGSGFFVSSEGDILTNAHVVEDVRQVEVVLHDGRRATGEVVDRHENWDLAIVNVDIDDIDALPLAPMDDVAVGDWAAAVGHGYGAIWTYTTGMISNIYPDGEDRPLFQTQIPVNPGNSGGPVVDKDGRVIGIVTLSALQAQNLNLAIPVEQAIARLETLAERCDCLTVELPEGVPLFVDDVMVGTGPRVVIMAERGEYEIVTVVDGQPIRKTVSWPETRLLKLGE
jgi:serine protease Do